MNARTTAGTRLPSLASRIRSPHSADPSRTTRAEAQPSAADGWSDTDGPQRKKGIFERFIQPLVADKLPGATIDDALARVKKLNADGIKGSISFLPVRHDTREGAQRDVDEYKRLLDGIASSGVDADVTIKLHQFGVHGGYDIAKDALSQVVAHAKSLGNFVWIDMEVASTTDDTVKLFKEMHEAYGNVGICLQAYRARTEDDLKDVVALGAPVRLVKGFYRDNDFASWADVTQNYRKLMPQVIEGSPAPAIAGHDMSIVPEAARLIEESGKKGTAELQFFAGVRDEEAKAFAQDGHAVRIYVPYGDFVPFVKEGHSTFDLWRAVQRLLKRDPIQ